MNYHIPIVTIKLWKHSEAKPAGSIPSMDTLMTSHDLGKCLHCCQNLVEAPLIWKFRESEASWGWVKAINDGLPSIFLNQSLCDFDPGTQTRSGPCAGIPCQQRTETVQRVLSHRACSSFLHSEEPFVSQKLQNSCNLARKGGFSIKSRSSYARCTSSSFFPLPLPWQSDAPVHKEAQWFQVLPAVKAHESPIRHR